MAEPAARVYLDHNASSPLRPEARRAMEAALAPGIANPASLHHEGRAARAIVERAREQVAELTGTSAGEVVFTSGGSEALAAAIRGVCDRAPEPLRRIVVSAIEHSAVLEEARHAARSGFRVDRVPCAESGRVDADRFVELLGPDVALACLQWANNETGVLQPVAEVGRVCRESGVPFLVDAVQAAGRVALDARKVHADLLVVSGHKIGGPQGTGALVVRRGIVLAPLIAGGAQERRRRAGTQSVAALAGFGAAAALAALRIQEGAERLLRLRAKIETGMRKLYPEVRIHGQGAPRLPTTTNFSLPGIAGEVLVIAFDLAGVALSTGSACASGAVEPSHVIQAMGFAESEARGAVRLSLGWSSTGEEADRFLELFPGVVEQVRDGSVRQYH